MWKIFLIESSIVLIFTAFIFADSVCFAASLATPILILPGQAINGNYMASDGDSNLHTWSGNSCKAACLPALTMDDLHQENGCWCQKCRLCGSAQELQNPFDVEDWIPLWNAFDLTPKMTVGITPGMGGSFE